MESMGIRDMNNLAFFKGKKVFLTGHTGFIEEGICRDRLFPNRYNRASQERFSISVGVVSR